MDTSREQFDVIVVGAGPTGLALAASLALRGFRIAVLDAQAAGANTSRAAVIHAHTLEELESIGVTAELVRRGVHARRFTIRDRDRLLVAVPFGDLPTRYPYTLMISQAETEQVLRARLTQLGVEVRWNSAVAKVTQDARGARVRLADGGELVAEYVVGADGMHSTVRAGLDIRFDGARYEQSFMLADVELEGAVPSDEVVLYFSPAGLVVVAPLPGGAHRIVATLDQAPENPCTGDVQALLDTRGPLHSRIRVRHFIWGSRFRVHHRLASHYRRGRVVLAGDAAHVHSPAGGQGMNTGIVDGLALAAALETALRQGEPGSLDVYTSTRRPVAKKVIALADNLTRMATMKPALRPLRNLVLGLLGNIPAFQRRLAWRLSGLVNRGPRVDGPASGDDAAALRT
jgi:2-polyprenyl-6-methoxyphenol hydroxylase-like FAD-dependent oxidoreductase